MQHVTMDYLLKSQVFKTTWNRKQEYKRNNTAISLNNKSKIKDYTNLHHALSLEQKIKNNDNQSTRQRQSKHLQVYWDFNKFLIS